MTIPKFLAGYLAGCLLLYLTAWLLAAPPAPFELLVQDAEGFNQTAADLFHCDTQVHKGDRLADALRALGRCTKRP